MKKVDNSPVQIVMGTLREASMEATGHSWTRLNGAMRKTMGNLISAGVKFEIEDISIALSGRNSGYWSDCEGWYSSACGSQHGDGGGNTSAALSIEKYLGRTPFVWAERTKTPGRLCIGLQFTWKGERVTVTSFDDAAKKLTACSYTEEPEGDGEVVGGRIYTRGGYRIIEAHTTYEDGSFVERYSAKVEYERKKVKKLFWISNEEMATVRAEYDSRRRKHEKAIKSAKTLDELETAKSAAADEGQSAYRHFDLEIIQAAIATRREGIINGMPTDAERAKAIKEESDKAAERNRVAMAEWLAGGDVRPYFDGIVQLRIKGDFIECSNGNKVSLESALKTLPLVQRYREKGWESNGQTHDVDAFRLEKIDQSGVKIGCTLIPWEEVDRFTPILKKTRTTKAELEEAGA